MSRFAINTPYLVVVVCLIIAILGGVAVVRMPVDMFPSMNIPVVVVATFYAGMPPEQIEGDITYHLERFFMLAGGIDHIRELTRGADFGQAPLFPRCSACIGEAPASWIRGRCICRAVRTFSGRSLVWGCRLCARWPRLMRLCGPLLMCAGGEDCSAPCRSASGRCSRSSWAKAGRSRQGNWRTKCSASSCGGVLRHCSTERPVMFIT